MTEVSVGQKVTICNREPRSVTTVTKVGSAKILTADGGAWKTRNLMAWGASSWSFISIRPWKPEDDAIIRRKNNEALAVSYVGQRGMRGFSDDQVARIAAVIRERLAELDNPQPQAIAASNEQQGEGR